MNEQIIKSFYNEVIEQLGNEYKIVLEPDSKLNFSFIEKDSVKWELEDSLTEIVNELKSNSQLSLEEKILELYEFICLNYIYDDNVLFFFKKDKTDINNIKYIAVDWYGRIINNNWIEKRKNHNRRICYEYSRFFAKAINMFIGENNSMESFILGLKDNTHYVTVISGDNYSAILDLDDFNKIKDLTRIKLGLTMEGIEVLKDNKNILSNAISKYNENKLSELPKVNALSNDNTLSYIKDVIAIIKKYNLDPQGFQEYMKNILENLDIDTDKIWEKETDFPEKRYVRCLVFEYDNKRYLVDSIEQTLVLFNEKNLDKERFVINPEEKYYEYHGE